MKAMVYKGVDQVCLEEKPIPQIIKPTDAIVKVLKTTICGTDLHIAKGDVPAVKPGTTLGHEGVGIVEQVGDSVTNVKKGDKVLISCISSCGSCYYCKEKLTSHCEDGSWVLGHLIDGTMAEYVRIPHANNSLHLIPSEVDDEALVMLSDIFPTSLEIGVQDGNVQPGKTVAIVGAGPIGIAAVINAKLYSPAKIIVVDGDQNRLQVAKQLGATDTVNITEVADPVSEILKLTNGVGVDTAIEAVGIPQTFTTCQQILKPGATLANVGVHGCSVDLQLQNLWIKNIKITTGLVNAVTTPMLIKTVKAGTIDPGKLITHRFKFTEFEQAWNTFKNAIPNKAIKVIISVA